MTDIQHRSAAVETVEGRTVFGLAVPYSTETHITDVLGQYREQFEPGAFTRSIAQRGDKIKLLVNHERRNLPVGKASRLYEDGSGLHAEFQVAQTRAGDELLELVKAGVVDSFSVGFKSIRDKWTENRSRRQVIEAALYEVSAVGFPAYEGASIAGVRSVELPSRTITFAQAERLLSLGD